MAKQTLPNTGVVIWTAGTDSVSRTDFNNAHTNIEARVVVINKQASRPPAGTSNRLWVDPATKQVFYDDGSAWIAVGSSTASSVVSGSDPAKVPDVVKGAPGQTASLQEWQNSTGAILAFIASNGAASFKENVLGGSDGALLTSPGLPGRIGAIIRASAAQTASLTEWQGSGGAVLASMSAAGALTAAQGSFSGNLISSTTVRGKSVESETSVISNTGGSVQLMLRSTGMSTSDYLSAINSSEEPVARIEATGLIYATRLAVGQTSGVTQATAHVQSIYKNFPSLKILNAVDQTARSIDVLNGAQSIFSVAANGDVQATGAVQSAGRGIFQSGIYNTTTPTVVGGNTPAMEIVTGTGSEAFSDEVVLRHGGPSGNAVVRSSKISFRLGATGSSDAQAASLGVVSDGANATKPKITFWQAGQQVAQFLDDKTLNLAGDVRPDSHMTFDGGANKQNIVLDPSKNVAVGNALGTGYFRFSNQFMFVSGGTHADGSNMIAQNGGVVAAKLDTGALTLPSRLVVENTQLFEGRLHTLVPDAGGATIYGNLGLNAHTANAGGSVTISTNNGSTKMRGDTDVDKLSIGGRRISIGSSAHSSPSVGDIWIKV